MTDSIDMAQVETDWTYAAQVRDRLAGDLTPQQIRHLDSAFQSRREGILLDAKRTWGSFFEHGELWTEPMERYWQCLITLHNHRAPEPVPACPIASGRRLSMSDYLAARGD